LSQDDDDDDDNDRFQDSAGALLSWRATCAAQKGIGISAAMRLQRKDININEPL